MKRDDLKDGIIIAAARKEFETNTGDTPTEDDMLDLEEAILSEEPIRDVIYYSMDEFARREKLQAAKVVLEEMANAWLKAEKEKEEITDPDDDSIVSLMVSPIMDISELVDHLNFEVFRHRYPQITFENGGNRITVSIKE